MKINSAENQSCCRIQVASQHLPEAPQLNDWVRHGHRAVEVSEEVLVEETRPHEAAEFLRFLRDAAGAGIGVSWRGRIELDEPAQMFSHLAAPGSPSTTGALGDGQICHWRQGPAFVQVTDRRDGAERVMTFGEESLLRAFARIQRPLNTSSASLTELDRRAVSFLCEQRIGSRIGPLVLALPCRVKRWPMPAFA
ncbi:DUF5825 family protein [Streptomyces sp. NPDC059445]|uniref:DUF5825 family protein n=1 Tax=Streptomyces sp. NPDC059445 TaxID=3346832 RepID=UPI00369AE5B2